MELLGEQLELYSSVFMLIYCMLQHIGNIEYQVNYGYLHNHLPTDKIIAPIDRFTGATSPRHKVRDWYIGGAAVYVLGLTFQAGKIT